MPVGQDAHIGAAAGPALLHHVGQLVEKLHEGDRAGSHAVGLLDRVALRAYAAEREAGAAAGFLDQALGGEGLGDPFHGVWHREDIAGGELLEVAPGVHQGGGIRQEVELRHHIVETGLPGVGGRARVVDLFVGLFEVGHELHEIGFALGRLREALVENEGAGSGFAGLVLQDAEIHALEDAPFLGVVVEDDLRKGNVMSYALEKVLGRVIVTEIFVLDNLGLIFADGDCFSGDCDCLHSGGVLGFSFPRTFQ